LIERQPRDCAPAHLKLLAHGIGRERSHGAAEDRVHRSGNSAAPGEIDLDALREERVRIRVVILDDLQAVGEGERLRITECLGGEVVEAERTVAQADGADILQAEPCVVGRHQLRDRAADQPRGQRRDAETARNDPLGGYVLFPHQALQGVDPAMRGTCARKWLAAKFGDAPGMAELVEWRRVGHTFEQGEIAIQVIGRPVLVGADLEEIPEPGQTRSIEIKPISFSHSRSRQIDARCQG